jgi:hypothetical protein
MEATPTCPRCSKKMVKRNGQHGQFWGCSGYRFGCRGTRSIKAEAVVNAARVVPVGSPEQELIWNEIINGTGHVLANALAGTGKSFTAREGMHRVPKNLRQLYLAFGTDIVKEFRGTAPGHVDIATLNAIGWRIVQACLKVKEVTPDKVKDLIDEVWSPKTEAEIDFAPTLVNAVEKLVNLCQSYLAEPTTETLMELALRHDVELTSDVEELAFKLAAQVLDLDRNRTGVASYNDQVWFPIVHNLPCEKYDLIYVDEAQDLNAAQHQLVLKLLAPGGRVVIVGDNNQAIFGFRGSDVDSIANLCKLLTEKTGKPVVELGLTVSRRCSKKVIADAQQWVPSIKAMDDAPEGEVVETDIATGIGMIKPGDMVLCRCNAPLTSIAYGLIKQGIKAVIRGRDIGQGLLNVIKARRAKDVNDLLVKLDKWTANEIAKVAGTRRENSVAQRVTDQADCIRALAEGSDTLSDLKARIVSIFTNFEANGAPKGAVVLSSIHKAKGLEAVTVFWVKPEITLKTTQEWQARQEDNLRYVAATRAKLTTVKMYEKRAA